MMTLVQSLQAAAEDLRQATTQAHDWRVRNSIADAATLIQCALFIQEKVASGKMKIEWQPPYGPAVKQG